MSKSKIIGVTLLVIVLVGYTWATWQFFTRPLPGGNDFLTHYAAWEAYLRHGDSPYSDEAALHTQRAIYGRPALPGEDQNRMVYPFYSIVIHGPFALIGDYPLARALYMTLSQLALWAGVILCLRLFRWLPPAGLLAFVLAWTLLYYHVARGILIGQFAILAFGALAATLFFWWRKQDALAGAIFVVTTIKPPLVFLVAPFWLGWNMARRRWHFVTAFGVVWLILIVGSFILLPTWFTDWVYRMTHYTGYTANQSPVWTIALLGPVVTVIYVGVLVLLLLCSWWRALQVSDEREFYWTLGITLIVTNLISPRTATTDYVLMLVPTLGLFVALDRTPRWGRLLLITLLFISLVGLWWLHLSTVQGNWEQSVMYLPWPFTLGIVWVVGRRWLLDRWIGLIQAGQ
jgi:hypothetical protein